MNKLFNKKNILVFVYVIIGLFFLYCMPGSMSNEMSKNYIVLLVSYFLVFGIWIYYIVKQGFYLFEPSTMIISLTAISFSIEPIISILTNDTELAGFEVFNGCVKATIIYMVAIVMFMLIYYGKKHLIQEWRYKDNDKVAFETVKSKLFMGGAYFFAIVGTSVLILDTFQSGYNIQYIFSLGLKGQLDASESSIGTLINLQYCIAPSFLYLDQYDKRKWPVLVLRTIAFFSLLTKTTRWFLVVLLISPIVYRNVISGKKVKLGKIIVAACIIAFIIGAMQFTRGNVRDGAGIASADWSDFSLLTIWYAFSGNFDLYKTLYGAVTYFPKNHFYTLGQQMIYLTAVTCIPRSIWPGKPRSIIDSELKQYFMGNGAVTGHWAYAQLTEFYVEFGIIGVICCMSLFALWCRSLKKLYIRKKNVHNIIYYAIMFPFLMQLVIRGYAPINFWAYFFMVLPIIVQKKINKCTVIHYNMVGKE